MPHKPRAFVVTLVFGDRAGLISTGFWIANESWGASALAVHAASKSHDLPPLAGCTVTEITEDHLKFLLNAMQNAELNANKQLEFVKPEGSA